MVTTTALPLRTRLPPRYRNTDPLPDVKPPPWMNTMTGLPSPDRSVGASGSCGVQTLSERQSSLCGSEVSGSEGLVIPGSGGDWGAIGPKVDASLTLSHASAGCGGRQRRAPTGASA